jgi:parallel beta-helix repeat protein
MILLSFSFVQAAWWNESWNKCRNLTFYSENNLSRTKEAIKIMISDDNIKGCDELRFVNAPCNEGGAEIPSQIIDDSDETNGNCLMLILVDTPADSDVTYSVYYNNPSATAPTYLDEIIVTEDSSYWIISGNSYKNLKFKKNGGLFAYFEDANGHIIGGSENFLQGNTGIYPSGEENYFTNLDSDDNCLMTNGSLGVKIDCTDGETSSIHVEWWFYPDYFDFNFNVTALNDERDWDFGNKFVTKGTGHNFYYTNTSGDQSEFNPGYKINGVNKGYVVHDIQGYVNLIKLWDFSTIISGGDQFALEDYGGTTYNYHGYMPQDGCDMDMNDYYGRFAFDYDPPTNELGLKEETKFLNPLKYEISPEENRPIPCGDTITTNTVLTENLSNCSGNGLMIGTNGITLDCNGHSIIGDGDLTGEGIYLIETNGVTIKNCIVTQFKNGIIIERGSNNFLTNNVFKENKEQGIVLYVTNKNVLRNNSMLDNMINIANSGSGPGDYSYEYDNDVDTSNTVNGKPVIYINGKSDFVLDGNYTNHITIGNGHNITVKNIKIDHGDRMQIGYSTNVTISDNEISSNAQGITLHWTTNSLVTRNYLKDNRFNKSEGVIFLFRADDNIVRENYVVSNDIGIGFWRSGNNVIYHNNFINNTPQVLDMYPTGTNYMYSTSLLEGNYWSDYTGLDDGSGTGKHAIAGDGIGDTNIPHYEDYYPLIHEYEWLNCVIPTDGMIINESTTFCPGNYNLPNGISIGTNDITLDCNYSVLIGGTDWHNAEIYVNNIFNTTIKNCIISNASNGISLNNTHNSLLENNKVYALNNLWGSGIKLHYSNNNTLMFNNATNSSTNGFVLTNSNNNRLINNFASNNGNPGFNINYGLNNLLINNTAKDNAWMDFVINCCNNILINNTAINTVSEPSSGWWGFMLAGSTGNNTLISNNAIETDFGFVLYYTNGNNLTDNVATNSHRYGASVQGSNDTIISSNVFQGSEEYGIAIFKSSSRNTLTNNLFEDNSFGIVLHETNDINITDNIVINNHNYSIVIVTSNNTIVSSNLCQGNQMGVVAHTYSYRNTVINNSIKNNWMYGLYFSNTTYENIIYHNNIVNNTNQTVDFSANNFWDKDKGGNYWSNYDDQSEGCYDLNHDGICDSPYIIDVDSQDNYPFTHENGWLLPPVITILYPINNKSYYKTYIPLNFTIDKSTSWIGYSLNNTPNITISGPINMTGIADKWNNVTVYANDSSGNMGKSGTVYFFYCLGDIISDKKIDARDVALVASLYGAKCGNTKYNPNADLNDDCKIDARDVSLVASLFGKKCS